MTLRNVASSTRTIEITEVSQRLSPLANQVAKEGIRVIVEEAGTPLAAIVPLRDLEQSAQSARDREAAFAIIDEMREAFADVSSEEIEREVAKAVAEVRTEMAAERAASEAAV